MQHRALHHTLAADPQTFGQAVVNVALAVFESLVRLQKHAGSLTLQRTGCLRAGSSHTAPWRSAHAKSPANRAHGVAKKSKSLEICESRANPVTIDGPRLWHDFTCLNKSGTESISSGYACKNSIGPIARFRIPPLFIAAGMLPGHLVHDELPSPPAT